MCSSSSHKKDSPLSWTGNLVQNSTEPAWSDKVNVREGAFDSSLTDGTVGCKGLMWMTRWDWFRVALGTLGPLIHQSDLKLSLLFYLCLQSKKAVAQDSAALALAARSPGAPEWGAGRGRLILALRTLMEAPPSHSPVPTGQPHRPRSWVFLFLFCFVVFFHCKAEQMTFQAGRNVNHYMGSQTACEWSTQPTQENAGEGLSSSTLQYLTLSKNKLFKLYRHRLSVVLESGI